MGKNVVVEGFDNAANWVYRASSYNTTSYIIWQQGSGRFGGHSANCQYNSGAYVRWDYVPDAAIDCTLGFAYYNGIGNIQHYFFDSAGSIRCIVFNQDGDAHGDRARRSSDSGQPGDGIPRNRSEGIPVAGNLPKLRRL